MGETTREATTGSCGDPGALRRQTVERRSPWYAKARGTISAGLRRGRVSRRQRDGYFVMMTRCLTLRNSFGSRMWSSIRPPTAFSS